MDEHTPGLGRLDPAGTHTLEVIAKADQFNKWMYQAILPYLKGEVLEIGAGIGNISRYAVADGLSITLSDFNAEYREFLATRFAGTASVKDVISIDLQHPDFATAYSHLKETFDSIFLLNVIEHLENDTVAVENCRFLLKPGGNLAVLAPAYPFLFCKFDRQLGHYRRYSRKSLASVFSKEHFTIIAGMYFNLAGVAGWFLFGKLLRRSLIGAGEMRAFNRLVPLFRGIDRLFFNAAGLSVILIAQKSYPHA